MHTATINALFDELSQIEKEAGLKDTAKAGVQAVGKGLKKVPQYHDRLKAKAVTTAGTVARKYPGLYEAAHDPETWNAVIRGIGRFT